MPEKSAVPGTKGSLCVVGTGIQLMGQVTLESESAMRSASKLFYLVTDPVTQGWLVELNRSAEDLIDLYGFGKQRIETYNAMVQRILDAVRAGESVCAAFYGHPGVFVYPSHKVIELARSEGFEAVMFPGISAEDCLFADLGIDPGSSGCQSFEATDFLVYSRKFDERVTLILWQISCIGQFTHESEYSYEGLAVLSKKLSAAYGVDHTAIVYEAARYPVCPPVIHRTTIGQLHNAPVSGISTLVVPPKKGAEVDIEMVRALNISEDYIRTKATRLPESVLQA